MSQSSSATGIYDAAWNQFLRDARSLLDTATAYVGELSEAEKLTGVGIFVLIFLLMLLTLTSMKKKNSGSNGRQFSGAMFVVIVIAFGVGWTWDTTSGSMSHFFGR